MCSGGDESCVKLAIVLLSNQTTMRKNAKISKKYAHFFYFFMRVGIFIVSLQPNLKAMKTNNISNLRNRSLFLFADEEMNPRQDANREEVLTVFTPLAGNIVAKILEAGDCYLQYAESHAIARRENTFCSSNMHGLIIEYLTQVYGVRVTQFSKGNSIVEIGNYKVWVKKLDDNGLPWVNETKSSTKRIYQKAEGEDTMPMLILGYQLDEIERISHIYIMYLEGNRHIWAPIDIGNMVASNQIEVITNAPSDEPLVTVKPEKQKGKEAV